MRLLVHFILFAAFLTAADARAEGLDLSGERELAFETLPGLQYRVEYSTNLVAWVETGLEFTGSGSLHTVQVPDMGASAYYRLVDNRPSLAGLQLSTGARSLHPAYDPDVSRYSLVTELAVSNATLVIERNDPGHEVTVNGGVVSGELAFLADIQASTGLVVRVTDTNTLLSTVYEVVVLPPAFPDITVDFGGIPTPGLLLLAPFYRDANGVGLAFITVMDNQGVPRFFRQTNRTVRDFKRHANGQYSYHERTVTNAFGRFSGEQVILDAAFNELKRVQTAGLSHTDTHDFLILENGNYLFLSYDGVYRDWPGKQPGDPDFLEDTVVQETDPEGNPVWEWRSWGAIPLEDRLTTRSPTDYAHGNAFWIDDDGHLLLSLRGTSQVVKIDRNTGAVIWKMSGLSNDFTFVNDPWGGFCGQHTVSRLANGNLMVFDNGQFCPPGSPHPAQSRVAEYRVDETTLHAELVWSHTREGFLTRSQGSSFRLSNGHTLISWGRGVPIMCSEVDATGRILMDLRASKDGTEVLSYRAYRIPNL